MSMWKEILFRMRNLSPEIEVTEHPELCSMSVGWGDAFDGVTITAEEVTRALDTWAKAVGLDPSFTTDKLMGWPTNPADRYAPVIRVGRNVSGPTYFDDIGVTDDVRPAIDEKAWEALVVGDEAHQDGGIRWRKH